MNIENFKALVSGWCQSQDSFLKIFDKNNDGVVIKSEFQNVCLTKDNSLGPDLIDQFWNSFDINCGDGKIKGTNLFNLNAIDGNELLMISGDLKITGDLVASIDKYLEDLKDYTNTYNYIQGETLTYTKDNNITDESLIKAYIDELIRYQEDGLKEAIAKDAMVIILNGHTYTRVEGYDPYNDPTLLARVTSCVGKIVIADDKDPVNTVVKYFNNTNSDSDMGKIRGTINSYFSDDTSIDSDNNYQKARLNYEFTEQAKELLSIIEIETLKDQAKNFIDDAVSKAIGELYVKYKGVPMIVFYRADIACGDIGFESTNAGRLFKDYLEGLSLGDFNEKDDEEFFNELVDALIGYGLSSEDAEKAAKYLANNDSGNYFYQNIVKKVCEYLYGNTNYNNGQYSLTDFEGNEITSEIPLYQDYIIMAIIDGIPELGLSKIVGNLLDEAGVTKTENDETIEGGENGENNGEEISMTKLNNIGKISADSGFKYYDKNGNEYTLQGDFKNLYKDNYFVSVYGKHEENWKGVDTLTPAKKNLTKLADLIKESLLATGQFNESYLDVAVEAVINLYINALNKYEWTNRHDNVKMANTPGEFAKEKHDEITGLCYIFNDTGIGDAWEAGYYMVDFKEFTDAIVNEYNNINCGVTNLKQLDKTAFNGKNIAEILLDNTADGILLANWDTLGNAKNTAKGEIATVLGNLGTTLKKAGLDATKVDYAITTTIKLYQAAINKIIDYDGSSLSLKGTYKDADGEIKSYDYEYTHWTGEKESDSNIISGDGMHEITTEGGLGLRLEEAYNPDGGENTDDDNRYTIAVNMRCLLEIVDSFLN